MFNRPAFDANCCFEVELRSGCMMNTVTTSFHTDSVTARLDACTTMELTSDAFRPVFHKGDMLVVDNKAKLKADDMVAITFKNEKQFVALFNGKRNAQFMLFTIGGAGQAFALDEKSIASVGRIVAFYRP
jgi:phage repressor protein C with HTH and peptisase S24 domain